MVPHVTHGTSARRFSSSQMRLRTREKPPSASVFHSLLQVARGAQGQVHTLVEVVAGLAVAADDVLGHHTGQELARLGAGSASSSADSSTR